MFKLFYKNRQLISVNNKIVFMVDCASYIGFDLMIGGYYLKKYECVIDDIMTFNIFKNDTLKEAVNYGISCVNSLDIKDFEIQII